MVTVTLNFARIWGYIPLTEALAKVKNDKSKEDLEMFQRLRNLYNAGDFSAYNTLKVELPAFIVSGVYKGSYKKERLDESLKEYTQMVCLDFDKMPKEELDSVKKAICASPYTLSCFVSPSGHGLKVICKVSTGREYHSLAYRRLSKYYKQLIGYEADKTCHNIARLCFFSHDPDLYYNEDAEVYEVDLSHVVCAYDMFSQKNIEQCVVVQQDRFDESSIDSSVSTYKSIPGYKNFYVMSRDGRVKRKSISIKRKNGLNQRIKEMILKPKIHENGLLSVLLNKAGYKRRYFVHDLLAMTFIDNPNGYTRVRHKDGNRSNNSMDNLEWFPDEDETVSSNAA